MAIKDLEKKYEWILQLDCLATTFKETETEICTLWMWFKQIRKHRIATSGYLLKEKLYSIKILLNKSTYVF